jgi:hypothetical protein
MRATLKQTCPTEQPAERRSPIWQLFFDNPRSQELRSQEQLRHPHLATQPSHDLTLSPRSNAPQDCGKWRNGNFKSSPTDDDTIPWPHPSMPRQCFWSHSKREAESRQVVPNKFSMIRTGSMENKRHIQCGEGRLSSSAIQV